MYRSFSPHATQPWAETEKSPLGEVRDIVFIPSNKVSCWGCHHFVSLWSDPGFPGGSVVKDCLPVQEIEVQSLGWDDPLEEGNGNPLQHSSLENPMDRWAWQATVCDIPNNRTQLRSITTWSDLLQGDLRLSLFFGLSNAN